MISVSGKKWNEQKVDKNLIEKVKQDHNFNEILSKLIVSRNYDDDEISNIKNNLKLINVFNKSTDFDRASDILINSINKDLITPPELDFSLILFLLELAISNLL